MNRFNLFFFVTVMLITTTGLMAQSAILTVNVKGIKEKTGSIRIGLYNKKEGFPDKADPFKGGVYDLKDMPNNREIVYRFSDIPHGDYAIAVFHDANSNDKLDKNFLGIPQEGYGFSRNPQSMFGPPDFDEASIHTQGINQVEIKLIY